MNVTLNLRGYEELRLALERIGSASASTQVTARALYKIGNQIVTAAKQETPVGGPPYSPRDPHPGQLRASGYAPFPVVEGTRVTQTVGFGGASRAYAVPQHEREDFRHHVGKANYLKDPFDRISPSLRSVVGDEMAAYIRSQGKT